MNSAERRQKEEKKEDLIQKILFENYELPPYIDMELEEATQKILADYDAFYLNEIQGSDKEYFSARISNLLEQETLLNECLDSYQNQLSLKNKIIKDLRNELERNLRKEKNTSSSRKGFIIFQSKT